jgi:hypothetical protein
MAQTPPPPPPPPPGSAGGGTYFQPRGIGDILSAAFDLYKRHWQSFLQIVAIVVIPLTILQYFLQDQLQTNSSVTVDQTTGAVEVNNGSLGRSLLLTLIVSLIGVLVTQLLTGAISRAAAGSLVGESVAPGDAFGYAFSRLGSILLVSILVGLIVAGGLILLIIPGIIFAVKLAVSIPALVVENRRGTDAIGRSWNLTTGHFWHVLGTYIVAAIIAGIVSGILTAIGGSNWFVRAILASIAAIITTPFTALVLILIYLDLRVRKEGLSDETLRRELAASRS